jgi:hypothetical protein
MRAPTCRSPGLLAATALAAGLIGKWAVDPAFSVGWTMVAILWVLPLVIVGTLDEYLPDGWSGEAMGPGFFSSRKNRLELLATIALPGLGFALDLGTSSFFTLAVLAVGAIGIGACVQLARLERNNGKAGHDR